MHSVLDAEDYANRSILTHMTGIKW